MDLRTTISSLLIFLILAGCVGNRFTLDEQTKIEHLTLVEEKSVLVDTYQSGVSEPCVRIMPNGDVVLKYAEYLEYDNGDFDLKYNYSLMKNREVVKTFSIEGQIINSNKLIDDFPSFMVTNDGKIVTSVSLYDNRKSKKIKHMYVPAIINPLTGEIEKVILESYFHPWFYQNKYSDILSMNSRFVRASAKSPLYIEFTIQKLKNDKKYNMTEDDIKIKSSHMERFIDVYPGGQSDEMLLMYNDEQNGILEIVNYRTKRIVQRYVFSKMLDTKGFVTFSPKRDKIIVYNNFGSLLVIFLEDNQFVEIKNTDWLYTLHDWAWDSNSVIFLSSANKLCQFSFDEDEVAQR